MCSSLLSFHLRRWFQFLPSLQLGIRQELAAGAFAAKIDCVLVGERLACVTVPDHPATATWAGKPAGREFIEFHFASPFHLATLAPNTMFRESLRYPTRYNYKPYIGDMQTDN
jgi:hypothetical protein